MSGKSKDCRSCSGKPTDKWLFNRISPPIKWGRGGITGASKKNKVNIEGLKDISENWWSFEYFFASGILYKIVLRKSQIKGSIL